MQPNWSKLEALGRAAAVLFLGTFFGALVFTGGQLPADWASWKPILGTALGAAVAAEIVWIRSQLAAAASALGLPAGTTTTTVAQQTITTPANDAKPAARGFVSTRLVVALAALCVAAVVGCGLFSALEPSAVDCGTRILNDAAKGMTIVQIVEDVGGPCALDAAAVMAALMASKDPKVTGSRAYAETLRARGALMQATP